jgi:hypothetical protein
MSKLQAPAKAGEDEVQSREARDIRPLYKVATFDDVVKSRIFTSNVIPAKAGIQEDQVVTNALDPGFRRGDDFLRGRHL